MTSSFCPFFRWVWTPYQFWIRKKCNLRQGTLHTGLYRAALRLPPGLDRAGPGCTGLHCRLDRVRYIRPTGLEGPQFYEAKVQMNRCFDPLSPYSTEGSVAHCWFPRIFIHWVQIWILASEIGVLQVSNKTSYTYHIFWHLDKKPIPFRFLKTRSEKIVY